jgi:hypothetical protein
MKMHVTYTNCHFTKLIKIDEIGINKSNLNYNFHNFKWFTMSWYYNAPVEWYCRLAGK